MTKYKKLPPSDERGNYLIGEHSEMKGRKLTDEHKRKVSEARKGFKMSEEQKQKLREARAKQDTGSLLAALRLRMKDANGAQQYVDPDLLPIVAEYEAPE